MQLTRQEIEIMKLLNECGFCLMRQVGQYFNLKKTRTYKLLKRLRQMDLVRYKRLMYDSPGVYFLSQKGAKQFDMPFMDHLPAGRFEHQVVVNDVFIQLKKIYPEAYWISERRLKYEKFREGLGKTGHLCDGILEFADKKIAIEIELSIKGRNRIEKIIKDYIAQFTFDEVWYFCAPSVLTLMSRLAAQYPFIKIYKINEFISC